MTVAAHAVGISVGASRARHHAARDGGVVGRQNERVVAAAVALGIGGAIAAGRRRTCGTAGAARSAILKRHRRTLGHTDAIVFQPLARPHTFSSRRPLQKMRSMG